MHFCILNPQDPADSTTITADLGAKPNFQCSTISCIIYMEPHVETNSVAFSLANKMKHIALLSHLLMLRPYNSSSNIFEFFPDRDRLNIFSMRIPREAVSPTEADSINVKIVNDQGYVCVEKTAVRELEIRGLLCDQCMQGRLHVTIEPRNQSQIFSRRETTVLDESRRREEICNLRPKHRCEGENVTITSIKHWQKDGCRWLFRGGRIGCCYSNRDFYTEYGGCNPFMQSPACREGSETPIIKEEGDTCTLFISNLGIKDSGNYLLSNVERGTPTFKFNLMVRYKTISLSNKVSNLRIKFHTFSEISQWLFCIFINQFFIKIFL